MRDENSLNDDFEEEGGGFKAWLEENLRIILSVLVVFAIAGGIYSYSQRAQAPVISDESVVDTESADVAISDEGGAESEDVGEEASSETTAPEVKEQEGSESSTVAKPSEPVPSVAGGESKETGEAFVETAVRGDSLTTLARRSLADSLEKNPDSSLTAAHKIYIEDYLRKHVGQTGDVRVGTSVSFSKNLIQEAIGHSKQLNDQQLSNLKKYVERVPSLR